MHASTTFHRVQHIWARSTETVGAPLILNLTGDGEQAEVILFMGDQALTDRLIKAINDTMDAWKAEHADPAVEA
jgi:hypothetical protein